MPSLPSSCYLSVAHPGGWGLHCLTELSTWVSFHLSSSWPPLIFTSSSFFYLPVPHGSGMVFLRVGTLWEVWPCDKFCCIAFQTFLFVCFYQFTCLFIHHLFLKTSKFIIYLIHQSPPIIYYIFYRLLVLPTYLSCLTYPSYLTFINHIY
jgi:hypothetical protein